MPAIDSVLVCQILFVVILWEVSKSVYRKFVGQGKPEKYTGPVVGDEELTVKVPRDPHFEIATDPPFGLVCSNPKAPHHFETEVTSGTYMVFHSPTGEGNRYGPDLFDYQEYFQGKSRLWEVRFHFKFKRALRDDEELVFGIELDEYLPLNALTRKAQAMIVACLQQACNGVYHSSGDDPTKTTGECEKPVCVLPLWAFDQFIETPEGEEPPSLGDPNFHEMGCKRYKRVSEYAKEIKELERRIRPGPTFTFAFWGVSRFLDAMNWSIVGVPLVSPEDITKFAGPPPVITTLYSLPRGDTKHLTSRKTYFFRAALWSSLRRPPADRIAEMLGTSVDTELLSTPAEKEKRTLRKRIGGFLKKFDANYGFSACTARER